MIVVDDGSFDATAQLVENYVAEIAALRLVRNDRNRGKGFSIKRGMREAKGRIALFTDADLSAPIEESGKLVALIAAGNDVVIGSRAVDRSLIETHQPRMREIAGIVFNKLVRLVTGVPFRDTQCGFKAFARERCRIIFEQQRVDRFGFDPEILFLARRQGFHIVEIPVRWAHDPATKVRVFPDSLLMLRELIQIRWNWFLNRYPRRASSVLEEKHREGWRVSQSS